MAEKGLFCGMNKPKDVAKMNDMEREHYPVIDCPDTIRPEEPFHVTIRIGETPHAMEVGHHIQWLDIYFGQNFNARIQFTPVFTRPEVTVTLIKGKKHGTSTLRVIGRCNVHGQWEATQEITIAG
ncbi:MAG: desulfoferrodoxin family protein [bacterium]|nr:desulfoferrodoxin family protein [bacterium]